MFEDAKKPLEQILSLVKLCPESLQEKCFELLLNAYLAQHTSASTPAVKAAATSAAAQATSTTASTSASAPGVPDAIRTRFFALASRTGTANDKAAALFDFNIDPFNYHALVVPGASKAERMKNLALMLALKSYLCDSKLGGRLEGVPRSLRRSRLLGSGKFGIYHEA